MGPEPISRRARLVFAVALVLGCCGAGPRLSDLTPAARSRLDARALAGPSVEGVGDLLAPAVDVTAWLLAQGVLSPEEERAAAEGAHGRILDRYPAVPTPAAAVRVLDRLVGALPPHLKPGAFRYSLTVLDRSGDAAFPCGGGFLVIPRPLLDRLLGGGTRGEAALAFMLAREIGHTARSHTRAAWQGVAIAEELAGRDFPPALGRRPAPGPHSPAPFAFSAAQHEGADCFALQLCRNAGYDPEDALDAVRLLALGGAGAGDTSDPLRRLRRLRAECDGLVDDRAAYGLFAYDRGTGALARCPDDAVGAAERPLVFVHGLGGGRSSFRAFLAAAAARPETRHRPLLVFAYPADGGLARCGRFLSREVGRVVASPENATFVCHSAGGLVFRHYAEACRGEFGRAFLLGTPHEGSDLTELKAALELVRFAGQLGRGPAAAAAALVPGGETLHDLHPDSLFLRRLGRDPALAARYHVVSGECLNRPEAFALQAAFLAGRQALRTLAARVEPAALRRRVLRRLDGLRLPPEVTHGDFVVSARSAGLEGAARATRTRLTHLGLRTDERVLREVLAADASPPGTGGFKPEGPPRAFGKIGGMP